MYCYCYLGEKEVGYCDERKCENRCHECLRFGLFAHVVLIWVHQETCEAVDGVRAGRVGQ